MRGGDCQPCRSPRALERRLKPASWVIDQRRPNGPPQDPGLLPGPAQRSRKVPLLSSLSDLSEAVGINPSLSLI